MDDAAVLALFAGPGVALSHATAARCHGLPLPGPRDGRVHITVPLDHWAARVRAPTLQGVVLHASPAGASRVRTGRDRLLATPPLATIADLHATLPLAHALCATDAALRRELLTREELLERPGLRRLAQLADRRAGSLFESLGRLAVILGGVGPVEPQHLLPGCCHPFDLALLWARLIAELDGREFHQDEDPESFAEDRAYGNAVATARGYRLVRIFYEQIWPSPLPFVRLLREAAGASTGQRARNLRRAERSALPPRTRARLERAWGIRPRSL